MTFVLSEITRLGVAMSSDSSETIERGTKEEFREVAKTLYFPQLNIGVSTWGEAELNGIEINDWLQSKCKEYCQTKKVRINFELASFTTFLAEHFDAALGLPVADQEQTHHLGVHVAGYNDGQNPGLCHVFIEPHKPSFEGQHTILSLPIHLPGYHLRNGIYKEFAFLWPALSGIDESFRLLIRHGWTEHLKPITDPVKVHSEWLGSWVKQMCLITKTAGLPEYVGKAVRVLAFDQHARPRWFQMPEMLEQ
ncbi:MAG: hypothetical protein KKF20_00655 [Bacteroidetes bacterium]|nr:hypothetical protein [Bacteroidota bacterium]MBU1423813.1 hypothetical protein [Bacteroidota bacterium]MBU2470901.1 hypothetical protein [Bacteroidota bacterium]MBU2637131.1 hypothetical protein [Bacteroidota bacterium]